MIAGYASIGISPIMPLAARSKGLGREKTAHGPPLSYTMYANPATAIKPKTHATLNSLARVRSSNVICSRTPPQLQGTANPT